MAIDSSSVLYTGNTPFSMTTQAAVQQNGVFLVDYGGHTVRANPLLDAPTNAPTEWPAKIPEYDGLKPLPCLYKHGKIDIHLWSICTAWAMKYHPDSQHLQRVCKASGAWCVRLYRDGDSAAMDVTTTGYEAG